MVRKFRAGVSEEAIRVEHNLSRPLFAWIIQTYGTQELRTRSLARAEEDEIVDLYTDGLSRREVAAEVGRSFSTVRTVLRQRGVG